MDGGEYVAKVDLELVLAIAAGAVVVAVVMLAIMFFVNGARFSRSLGNLQVLQKKADPISC